MWETIFFSIIGGYLQTQGGSYLQDKLCFWAILTEPLEKEACFHGQVEVDVVEVLYHQVVVLLRLCQHVLLHVTVVSKRSFGVKISL